MSGGICDSFLCLIDSALAICLFAPLVVGYWRGCWQLMDEFLFPGNKQYSLFASTAIGLGLGVFFGLAQNCFARSFPRGRRKFPFALLSRLYTIIYCVVCVNHWRGVWMMWDNYHGLTWQSGATSTVIGLALLALTRGVRNILAPPFVTIPDHRKGYFTVPTLFKSKKDQCCSFLTDVVFSVVVTGSLVVFVWRGSWVFLDRLLFPEDPKYSAWGSLVIGYSVTLLSFLTQLIMIPCLKRVKNIVAKVILEDVYFTICFVGAINIWRGVWNLLNIYLYPNNLSLSNMITTVGGNLVLMCLFNGNSILVRGAVMDGADMGAAGVTFQTQYIRSFFKNKDKKSGSFNVWEKVDTKRISTSPRGKHESVIRQENSVLIDSRGTGDGNSSSEGYGDLDNVRIVRTPNISKDILILEPAEESIPQVDTKSLHSSEEGETLM